MVVNCGGKSFTYRAENNAFAVLYEDNIDSDEEDETNLGIDPVDRLLREVREATGSKTLDYFYSVGRCGLKISWEETRAGLVPKLIQAFLDRGHAIYMNGGSQVTFPAYSYYSEALEECRAMVSMLNTVTLGGREMVKRWYSLDPAHWNVPWCKTMIKQVNELPNDDTKADLTPPLFQKEHHMCSRRRHRRYGVPWNSANEAEYREIQRQIRDTFDVELPPSKEDAEEKEDSAHPLKRARVEEAEAGDNADHPMVVEDSDGDDDAAAVTEKPEKEPEPIPENDECCICYERPANTMAWPCGHAVCCKQCSDNLKGTPNAHICVICRQPITKVLD